MEPRIKALWLDLGVGAIGFQGLRMIIDGPSFYSIVGAVLFLGALYVVKVRVDQLREVS